MAKFALFAGYVEACVDAPGSGPLTITFILGLTSKFMESPPTPIPDAEDGDHCLTDRATGSVNVDHDG